MNCSCERCNGALVSRRTWYRHKRERARQARSRSPPSGSGGDGPGHDPPALHDDAQVRDPDASAHAESDAELSDSASDSDTYDPLGLLGAVGVDEEEIERIGRGEVSPADITLLLLDLVSAHKLTDSAARDMWNVIRMIMPSDLEMKTFPQIKRILQDHQEKRVKRIEMCPNDCIAYWDSTHLSQRYQHAHRSKCPKCGTSRYVIDPQDGQLRARKVLTISILSNTISFTRELSSYTNTASNCTMKQLFDNCCVQTRT